MGNVQQMRSEVRGVKETHGHRATEEKCSRTGMDKRRRKRNNKANTMQTRHNGVACFELLRPIFNPVSILSPIYNLHDLILMLRPPSSTQLLLFGTKSFVLPASVPLAHSQLVCVLFLFSFCHFVQIGKIAPAARQSEQNRQNACTPYPRYLL